MDSVIRVVGIFALLSAHFSCSYAIARPTEDQMKWNNYELGGIVHFNMATFFTDTDGCMAQTPSLPNITLFNPTKLNIEQWAQSLKAYGARYAVMVVKHACGFALWPTKVAFPAFNFTYDYNIANSPFKGTADIAKDFITIMRKYGIAPGFYYTLSTNYYLNVVDNKVSGGPLKPGQVQVTQEQYYQIVLAQLTELWTQYGELAEVWFDGVFPHGIEPELTSMFQNYQPHAVAFQGEATTPNGVRWVGTESGMPKAPVWSVTRDFYNIDPRGTIWYPPECDTTLQQSDRWFYKAGIGIRSPEEMLQVYHDTVGNNCNMLLDFTPDTTGLIPTEYATAYKQLGDFIQSCYAGEPTIKTYGTGYVVEATVDPFVRVDRVVMQEAIEEGQRVLNYTLEVHLPAEGWELVENGQSIGHKRIITLDAAVQLDALRLTIHEALDEPIIHYFAGYDCSSDAQELVNLSQQH